MKNKLTKLTLFLFLMFTASLSFAQQWLGRTNSNYSGTYGIYNNASSISDSKYLFYFNFWGRGVNFNNNFLDYNAPIKLNKWANDNYDVLNPNNTYQKNWFLENLDGKDKYFSFNQDIWGPSIMFPISNKANFAINTRQRNSLQLFGVNQNFAVMARNGLDSSNGLARNTNFSNGEFGVNMQSFQELSFTLGGIMHQSKRHQLNGGVTLKLIRGLGAAYIKGDNMNLSINNDNTANISGEFKYAYTDDKSLINPFNDPYGLFSLNSKGAGAGVDLGFSYTFTSERLKYKNRQCDLNDRKSDYDFKLAMAINDIGEVQYNKGSQEYSFTSATPVMVRANRDISRGIRSNTINELDSLGSVIFAPLGANKTNGFSTSLPTAFNLQADFRLSKNIYTSVFWNQSLKGYNSTGMRSTSMLSVIPRIESRGFEFSMPLTLSENYKNFYVGAYARIGPVFFGSDNLGGLLNVSSNSQFRGADIYGGISFGIGHCHKVWFEEKVEPNRRDTNMIDTVRKEKIVEKRDTVKIIQKDTIRIYKKDTVFIDRNNNTEREKLYKKREEEINRKQKELERREREVIERERNTNVNDPEALRLCKNQNTTLINENNRIKTIVIEKDREIDLLKRELEVERQKTRKYELDLVNQRNCTDEINKKNQEILNLKNEIERNRKTNSETNAEVLKKCELDKKKAEYDVLVVRKQMDSLKLIIANKQIELDKCKVEKSTGDVKKCEEEKAKLNLELIEMSKTISRLNTKIYTLDYRVDSLFIELNNCKKLVNTNAEIVKKAETDKAKAEADAEIAKKKAAESEKLYLEKVAELELCKKNSTNTNAEVVKKAEADKAKAEADAEIARKKAAELEKTLDAKILELEECKKNSTGTNAELIKKAEADKAKAEADAEIAKKKAAELEKTLDAKILELEECKKNSTGTNAEVIKKAEADKAKAEADAEIARKKAAELEKALEEKTAELEKAKTNSSNCDAEIAKTKKCLDEKNMLNIEMKEMANNIGRLNTRNSQLTYKIDSLTKLLANCNSSSNSINNDDEALKKCQAAEIEYKAEIERLKKAISTNNAEIQQLKADKESLQNKVNSLTTQLNELRVEYNFMLKQSQKCKLQLDSCKRGLHDIVPDKKGDFEPTGSNFPNEEEENGNSVETKPKNNLGLKILGAVLEGVINSAGNSSTPSTPSTPNTSSTPSSKPAEPTTGTTTTKKPSSSNTGSGTGTNTGSTKPQETPASNDWKQKSTAPSSNTTTKPSETATPSSTTPSSSGSGSTRRR